MPSPGYSTRSVQPSRRTRSRRTSQATTYVDPAYAYDERDALLNSTRQGLHNVQQTYVKPIWDYDPEQVWTRKSSPNIPPLEHFLAEARAKYNHTDPTYVNPLPDYWSQGGYEYGYPHGISPPHRVDNYESVAKGFTVATRFAIATRFTVATRFEKFTAHVCAGRGASENDFESVATHVVPARGQDVN
ncbi:hypothetical protein Vi05172_g1545 [Venturia inaequalis]|uniref:Uncharacterized protein n=1 Tax=Venturia inaequalis TaxID=5025 RepID=A0A8H3VNQ0_VENIN|nr:hypothetical protein EG327_009708 [Venturia inaequalis]RDI88910.1 hypothetical protein Vi05172_g1545 [Venturia inaequalis]